MTCSSTFCHPQSFIHETKIYSEICVEMEKVPVSPLHIFLLSRHIFGMFKTAMIMLQYSIAQILNNAFKNKKRNVLCHWYIYAMKERDFPRALSTNEPAHEIMVLITSWRLSNVSIEPSLLTHMKYGSRRRV